MKCDRCDNEATVHEVIVKGGKRQERHLCEACARTEGMAGQQHIPLTQLLNQFITSHVQATHGTPPGPAAARAVPAGTCPACGTSLAQFRQVGLLGCPECYAAFEGQLSPLLQRAHEGGTHHQGKRPARARHGDPVSGVVSGSPPPPPPPPVPVPPPLARAKAKSTEPPSPVPAMTSPDTAAALAAKLKQLKQALQDAISKEKYEDAARIRDEIIKLEGGGGVGGARGSATKPPVAKRTPKPRPPTQPKPEAGPEAAE